MDSHDHSFIFSSPDGNPLRRSNFRQRYWRPAWDGVQPDDPSHKDHVPATLSWLTFHEGRHNHNTRMTEGGVPEVARRARLGQKMKGIARVYDHVSPAMTQHLLGALEARWTHSMTALTAADRAQLMLWFPRLRQTLEPGSNEPGQDHIAISSPFAS